MKLRIRLLGAIAVFLALVLATANVVLGGELGATTREEREKEPVPAIDPAPSTATPVRIPPLPSALLIADKILGSAYYDTASILSTRNSCSEFFGGSQHSLDVFQRYMANIRKDYLSVNVGMRMSGKTTNMHTLETNVVYRLFENMTVNANGPFYRQRFSRADPPVPRVAGFEPNSRSIRVLMLLHELGHLIMGRDGKWLLPDDGGNPQLSGENSVKIKAVCGEQIKWL